MFIEPHFDDLDRLALEIATDDRFRPGTLNRAPVPVLASLEALIKRSILDSADAGGKQEQILGLRELAGPALGRPARAKGENDLRRFIAGSEGSKDPDISARLALNSVAAQDSPEA